MTAGKHRENLDVEQSKKMVPSRVTLPLINMSASWFLSSQSPSFVLFDIACSQLLREEEADVEQPKKMVPLITYEASSGQHVSKLFLGVNIFDLDLWF